MSEWSIYGSNGITVKATVKKLEYVGEFMGESYVTCDIVSPTPITLEIGDYLMYRGEKFSIGTSPNELKQARTQTYGEGFKSSSVKFTQDSINKLDSCLFLDYVPNDNGVHYPMPNFSFYGTVSNLVERIEANLERFYGESPFTFTIDQSVSSTELNVSVDDISCWEALKKVYDLFNITFFIKGETIQVGGEASYSGLSSQLFTYGKGNGLKSIEKVASSDRDVITHLTAYGSSKNLPTSYYQNLGLSVYSPITEVYTVTETGTDIHIPTSFRNCFTTKSNDSNINFTCTVTLDGTTEVVGIFSNNKNSTVNYDVVTVYLVNNPDTFADFITQLQSGTYTKLYFTAGVNKLSWPTQYREYANGSYSGTGVTNLMLPGFPLESLHSAIGTDPTGYTLSTVATRPYIEVDGASVEKERTVYFDGSDSNLVEIYPTLEGMTSTSIGLTPNQGNLDEMATDAVELDGSAITSDGIYASNAPKFKVSIKNVGFDINDYLTTTKATFSMTSGQCMGREFIISQCVKDGNYYVLTCERSYDSSLNMYFPNKDYTIDAGDKFVLLNIYMPEVYVEAASQRLYEAALTYLEAYSQPKYTYTPTIDNIYVARQNDSATQAASIYYNIKEGQLFRFSDTDLNIDKSGGVFIDRLNIKEGISLIPELSVVLREEKDLTTLQKLNNEISKVSASVSATESKVSTTSSIDVDSLSGNFVTIEFFDQLFQAHGVQNDEEIDIQTNDVSKTITDLEFKKGSWSQSFLSALGKGTSSSGNVDLAAIWASLTKEVTDIYADSKIHTDHIPIDGTTIVENNGVISAVGGGGGSGSVTEVSAGTGLETSDGNPITSTGTLSIDTDWMDSHYVEKNTEGYVVGDLSPANGESNNLGNRLKGWNYLYAYNIGESNWRVTNGFFTNLNATNITGTLNGSSSQVYVTRNANKKAYVTGATTTNSTSGNGTMYFDPNVYLSTTSGELVAKWLYATSGIDSAGYITALSTNSSSDERMKDILYTNLVPLDVIANAPSVDFLWKHNGKKSSGSIAQYWQRHLPNLVHANSDGMLSMEYGNIALMSVISVANEVVTLKEENKTLREENKRMKDEIEELKDEIRELKELFKELKGGKQCL